MKTLLLMFICVCFSCSNDFRKITAISEIDGSWGNNKESFLINTNKMTIHYPDSTFLVLTSRTYDRSKITVSSGSVIFFDAHVFINSDGSSIKINKINKQESSTYFKK